MEGPLAWGDLMAAAIAGSDEAKMARLREICGRFRDAEEMHQESRRVVEEASEEEQSWISGKAPLEILYWAMMEAESNDPVQRARWYRYASQDWVSSNLVWDGVRVVTTTTRSPPHCPVMPVVTDDDVRVVPRQNVARVVSQLPRRSPRFPRRSARIQALAQSAADE
ncbi:hypothetical protein CFC21_074108 [Triticum aestivum]|uniref:Uncharacterized protein n=2 Tax=Triticum aestivum TaxID=4565 RepID=A0A9R1HN01_WHEAT|nr:uncharacterized protein LOC119306477 [Triticum dicoccoides]KAF7068338.1 hypothetical protein CFC21_074108 [Triticum aestivum]